MGGARDHRRWIGPWCTKLAGLHWASPWISNFFGGGTNSTQLRTLRFLCFTVPNAINDSHPITSCGKACSQPFLLILALVLRGCLDQCSGENQKSSFANMEQSLLRQSCPQTHAVLPAWDRSLWRHLSARGSQAAGLSSQQGSGDSSAIKARRMPSSLLHFFRVPPPPPALKPL